VTEKYQFSAKTQHSFKMRLASLGAEEGEGNIQKHDWADNK